MCLENVFTHTMKPSHICMCLSTQEYILNIKQVLKGYQDPIVQEMKTYAIAEVPLLVYLCIISYLVLQYPFPHEWWLLKWGKKQKYQSDPCGKLLCSSSCQGDVIHPVSKSEQLSHLEPDLQATMNMLWSLVKKWAKRGKNNYRHQ